MDKDTFYFEGKTIRQAKHGPAFIDGKCIDNGDWFVVNNCTCDDFSIATPGRIHEGKYGQIRLGHKYHECGDYHYPLIIVDIEGVRTTNLTIYDDVKAFVTADIYNKHSTEIEEMVVYGEVTIHNAKIKRLVLQPGSRTTIEDKCEIDEIEIFGLVHLYRKPKTIKLHPGGSIYRCWYSGEWDPNEKLENEVICDDGRHAIKNSLGLICG